MCRVGNDLVPGWVKSMPMLFEENFIPRMKAKSRRWQYAVGDAIDRARRNFLTATQGGEQVGEIDAFPIAFFQCAKHRARGLVFRVGQIAPG